MGLVFRPGFQTWISNCLEIHHLRKESLAWLGERVVFRKESLAYSTRTRYLVTDESHLGMHSLYGTVTTDCTYHAQGRLIMLQGPTCLTVAHTADTIRQIIECCVENEATPDSLRRTIPPSLPIHPGPQLSTGHRVQVTAVVLITTCPPLTLDSSATQGSPGLDPMQRTQPGHHHLVFNGQSMCQHTQAESWAVVLPSIPSLSRQERPKPSTKHQTGFLNPSYFVKM